MTKDEFVTVMMTPLEAATSTFGDDMIFDEHYEVFYQYVGDILCDYEKLHDKMYEKLNMFYEDHHIHDVTNEYDEDCEDCIREQQELNDEVAYQHNYYLSTR